MTRPRTIAHQPAAEKSNLASRFDTYPQLRAMRACIGAGNVERVAFLLGKLDPSTVYSWGERHPSAPRGEHTPRLRGPAQQLAVLVAVALENATTVEGHADAVAPIRWLAQQFGFLLLPVAVEPGCVLEVSGDLMEVVGGFVSSIAQRQADGEIDAQEAQELLEMIAPVLNALQRVHATLERAAVQKPRAITGT